MWFLQQLITPSLALLIAFTPFLADVAKADTTGNVMVSQIDLSSANTSSVSGTGGGVQAGHFELYQTPTGGHLLHGTVSDGTQATAIDFDGSTLALADGYSMKVEVTSDTPTQAVTKLSVTTADHRHATGSMLLDKQT